MELGFTAFGYGSVRFR